VARNTLFQLNWSEFGLLIGILGMMLALVGLIFFLHQSSF
jgi:hypothetical protein